MNIKNKLLFFLFSSIVDYTTEHSPSILTVADSARSPQLITVATNTARDQSTIAAAYTTGDWSLFSKAAHLVRDSWFISTARHATRD